MTTGSPSNSPPSSLLELELPDGRVIPYRVHKSGRYRRVRLRISLSGRLTVTAPQRLSRRALEDGVRGHREWVARHIPDKIPTVGLPERIVLPSTGESWDVVYRSRPGGRILARSSGCATLAVSGDLSDEGLVRKALRRWSLRRGKEILIPWLERLSNETSLSFSAVRIRGQKTRWGSCSAQGAIGLNHHLIFLEPALIRYVLIHELCHTREMNHSPAFWERMGRHDAETKEHRKSLRTAFRRLPSWLFED